MKQSVSLGLTLALLSLVGTAHAGKPRKHEFGVGAFGAVGGQFLDDSDDKTFKDGAGRTVIFPYPGFAGVGGGGGLSFHYMFRGFIGAELDFFYGYEQGTGKYTIDAFSTDLTLSQTALHIPLLLKAAVPGKSFRPFLLVGPEFVVPGGAEAEFDNPIILNKVKAHADFYTVLAFGLGGEIMLPVDGADLRIPFSLRGSYNFGTSDKAADRIDGEENLGAGGGLDFLSEWQYQAMFTLGVAYYFK